MLSSGTSNGKGKAGSRAVAYPLDRDLEAEAKQALLLVMVIYGKYRSLTVTNVNNEMSDL